MDEQPPGSPHQIAEAIRRRRVTDGRRSPRNRCTILGDGDLLGRTIDTFVMAQLRAEPAIAGRRVRLCHLRTKAGREEIDIVLELPGGNLIGIEIKTSASPRRSDAKHLYWLRDRFPSRFVAGVVFHTGPDIIELEDEILALPISTFWG